MRRKFDLRLLPPQPTLDFEASLWAAGFHKVAGIDEAGRGPLAGPVAAAAVLFPPDPAIAEQLGCCSENGRGGVRDSKQMTPAERETWAPLIKELAISYGIGFASPGEIDSLGIVPATRLAIQRALSCLSQAPDHLLLDFLALPGTPTPQTSLVKGDARSISIAAASVLAKTARDALLCEMDAQYPGYGLASNKGYGTPEHLAALARSGPCPIHRLSFQGVVDPQKISLDLRGKG